MDIQQLHVTNTNENGNEKSGGGGASGGNFMCTSRQSSTRWTPTTDQIRILKDLYYNYGVRSPNADQIQRISARLRQYGKIEGKNVFYWFQNHKARERQKKRFVSADPHVAITRGGGGSGGGSGGGGCWRAVDDPNVHSKFAPNFLSSGFSSASSSSCQGLMSMGQMGSYGYGGSVTVEKNFRDDCSISPSGDGPQNFGWISMDPYASSCTMFDKRSAFNEMENIIDEVQEEYQEDQDIATLPLFPMRGDDSINNFCNLKHEADHLGYFGSGGSGGWYEDAMGSSRASLELSLNSYAGGYPSST